MQDQILNYVERCRQGDSAAFRHIAEEYQHLVYTLAFRLLCNEPEARDITQDTFIKVWLNIDRYNGRYRFSTWIYRIACNCCYDLLRSRRGTLSAELTDCETVTTETGPEEHLLNREMKELIVKFTGELSPKQKIVFTLSEMEGLDVKEITIITGMSPGKIKSNLFLARKYIKSKIVDYE
jgi:RNA polymerase sigma-70 factor (ECF subfamily)